MDLVYSIELLITEKDNLNHKIVINKLDGIELRYQKEKIKQLDVAIEILQKEYLKGK